MTAAPAGPAGPPGARAELAHRIAAAVDVVADARRYGGAGVRIATQFRGGSVLGVRLGDDEIGVHIVAEDLHVAAVAEAVHVSVARALASTDEARPVVVYVEELDTGPDDDGESNADGTAVEPGTIAGLGPVRSSR